MDQRQRDICAHLRALSSTEAASWLMEHYPTSGDRWGEALLVMPHRSWKKQDQIRLARYYLSRIPYASARGYEAFASFMSLASLTAVLQDCIPESADTKDLLLYHLPPVLRRKPRSDKGPGPCPWPAGSACVSAGGNRHFLPS